MSVLVTGGAGYIGSHMVLALLDRGEEVVVLDDLSTGFEWAIPPGATFVRGDIGDEALVRRIVRDKGVSAVAHFAASLLVAESVRDPLAYYDNNVGRFCGLLRALVGEGVPHVILSSTAAVYGEGGAEAVAETAPVAPVSPYGSSKAMAETVLAEAARAHGLSYAALRYFNVAGADPAGRAGESTRDSTHLVKIAAEVATGRREFMRIFGSDYPTPDGTAIRDYVHVSDLADAHLAALDHLRAGGANLVANVGYGRGSSVREIVDLVGRAAGRPLDARLSDRRAGDPPAIVADASLIRRVTGWAPRRDDLRLIAEDALRWERILAERGLPG